MRTALLRYVPVVLGVLALAACGGLEKEAVTGAPDAGSVDGGPGNQNAANNDTSWTPPADYPAGPYGYNSNQTIADLTFIGIHSAAANGANPASATVGPIHFSDYRNSSYVALIVLAAAGWCTPCNEEQPDMVTNFQSWNPSGSAPQVGMLEVLVNNKTPGEPANMSFVDEWANMYSIPFDLGTDPTGVLMPYYDINAFPYNLVIRTSDMSIVWQENGEDISGLQAAVNWTLQNPNPVGTTP